jgi:integrase
MAAKFVLKDPKSSNPTLIYLIVNKGYKRYKFGTGMSVKPTKTYWNAKEQRFVESIKNVSTKDFNRKLQLMGDEALSIIYRYENERKELTNQTFIEEMSKVFRPNYLKPKEQLFIDYMESWYETLKAEKGLNMVKSRGTLINIIKKVFPMYSRIRFDDITLDFYNKLVAYLFEQNYKPNYVGTVIRNLKAFMNFTYINGLHSNRAFMQFKKMAEETDHVYLNKEEIEMIVKASVPKSYEITKDCFLIQCYTALRHSDLSTLTASDVKDGVLHKKTSKTGAIVSVPLHPRVLDILKKYNGFPKAEANQTMNRKIKDICRAAKLTRPVTIEETVKGKKEFRVYELCELVSTHTGRRTALTNMYLSKIDLFSLTKISGHTTVKQLQTYLRIDSFESAQNLKSHSFFAS